MSPTDVSPYWLLEVILANVYLFFSLLILVSQLHRQYQHFTLKNRPVPFVKKFVHYNALGWWLVLAIRATTQMAAAQGNIATSSLLEDQSVCAIFGCTNAVIYALYFTINTIARKPVPESIKKYMLWYLLVMHITFLIVDGIFIYLDEAWFYLVPLLTVAFWGCIELAGITKMYCGLAAILEDHSQSKGFGSSGTSTNMLKQAVTRLRNLCLVGGLALFLSILVTISTALDFAEFDHSVPCKTMAENKTEAQYDWKINFFLFVHILVHVTTIWYVWIPPMLPDLQDPNSRENSRNIPSHRREKSQQLKVQRIESSPVVLNTEKTPAVLKQPSESGVLKQHTTPQLDANGSLSLGVENVGMGGSARTDESGNGHSSIERPSGLLGTSAQTDESANGLASSPESPSAMEEEEV